MVSDLTCADTCFKPTPAGWEIRLQEDQEAMMLVALMLLATTGVSGLRSMVRPRSVVSMSSTIDDNIDIFCRRCNSFFEWTVLPPVRNAIAHRSAEDAIAPESNLQKLVSRPTSPGLSRPVWLVIAASVPTALGWYGFYKYSVEQERAVLSLDPACLASPTLR